jgi:predicted ArsR family transcriptional regulator
MTASTKAKILILLKRNGGHSVAELASELNLAPITVRQQITRLERDGLLVAEQRASPSGRPHYVFRLTEKARASAFPQRTDRIVEILVREIGALEGAELEGRSSEEKTCLVLQRVAQRLASEYAPLLESWPLHERVSFVTEVMHAEGGLAEWEKTDVGFEIRDFNCLFHRLLNQEGSSRICEWHQYFLRHTLAADVRPLPCSDTVGECCRFIVIEPVEASAG